MASARRRGKTWMGLYRDAEGRQRSAGSFATKKEALKAATVRHNRASNVQDLLRGAFQLRHIMIAAGRRFHHEDDVPVFIADNDPSMAGRAIFPRPQFPCGLPGPAWPQRAIYQRQASLRHLDGLLDTRPVTFSTCPDR
jgi:hypothetical protein